MASKSQLSQFKDGIFAGVLLCVLFCTFVLPVQVYAKDIPDTLPALNTFIETVKDGNAGSLRTTYQSVIILGSHNTFPS